MMQDTHFLFIVTSKTYSSLGRIIRFFTRFGYNHVSISLNEDLIPLYSFARYNYNAPFRGGFVEESWLRYLYKDNDIPISIYSIPIDEKQYLHIKELLVHMRNNGYRYDMFGAITRKKISSKRYTCLSFTGQILKEIGIIDNGKSISSIRALKKVLSNYYLEDRSILIKTRNTYTWGNDEYFKKKAK